MNIANGLKNPSRRTPQFYISTTYNLLSNKYLPISKTPTTLSIKSMQ